jgi:hypothetical protein
MNMLITSRDGRKYPAQSIKRSTRVYEKCFAGLPTWRVKGYNFLKDKAKDGTHD